MEQKSAEGRPEALFHVRLKDFSYLPSALRGHATVLLNEGLEIEVQSSDVIYLGFRCGTKALPAFFAWDLESVDCLVGPWG